MVSTRWHPNPSAQRQSLAYPSAQRWSLASPLGEVSDIFNGGPCGLGSLAGPPEGHLPHGSGDSVHIGYPGGLILHDAAITHHCHSRLHHCCQLQGVWGCLMSSLGWQVPPQTECYSSEAQRWCHLPCSFQWPNWWRGLWPCILDLQLFLHPLAEISLGVGHGSSPKKFQNNRIH